MLVLVAGRPLELGPVRDTIPGIVMAWYPGTEGGPALADVLFGDVQRRAASLPVSYPRTIGQLPIAYNHLPSGRPTVPRNRFTLRYLDEDVSPLFPFGFGLGYTRFAYSDFAVADATLTPRDTLEVQRHRDEYRASAIRPGRRAALHPRSGREPQPAGAGAQGVREGRAAAR